MVLKELSMRHALKGVLPFTKGLLPTKGQQAEKGGAMSGENDVS
jgi:hypothetical protein